MTYWQQVLQSELESRKSRNYSYSLRSFAASLDLSPAQLSQLLSGKRAFTKKTVRKILERLELSPFQQEKFLLSALASTPKEVNQGHSQIADDEFALIADWYHFAILSLSETKHAKATALWMSKRLGIEHGKAKEALERLERLKIIEVKNGRLRQIKKNLRTTTDVPSKAIRKYHRQNLELAAQKLESVPPEEREFTAITMAIDPANLKEAKKIINEFKRKLSELLSDGDPKEVYTFSAQLFPVTTTKENP